MSDMPDITFTLDSDAYDTYRVTPHTAPGESFVLAHVASSETATVNASEQRELTDKAERSGLAVTVK